MSDPRIDTGIERQLAARTAALEAGARHVGWKVAFGAPAMLEKFGLVAPAPGYLTDRTIVETGGNIDTSGWISPVVEFEVALFIGEDVGPGATPEQGRAAVTAIGAAIEIADIDIDLMPEHLVDIVAGNIFHRGLVLGERDWTRSGAVLDGMVASVSRDGQPLIETSDLEALTGEYGWVVTTVADSLATHGARVSAGDVIIGGSVISPLRVSSQHRFEFRLGGYPPLSVTAGPG